MKKSLVVGLGLVLATTGLTALSTLMWMLTVMWRNLSVVPIKEN